MSLVRIALLGLWAIGAQAFTPPLGAILSEIAVGRKSGALETVMHHQVRMAPDQQPLTIEERIVREKNQVLCFWKGPNFPEQGLVAQWIKGSYVFNKNLRAPSPSSIWLRYVTGGEEGELRAALQEERFIRSDQGLQYKPDFDPEGPPVAWEVTKSYLIHQDIFLSRLPQGVAITVVGSETPTARRAAFFDRSLRGISRLEWKEQQTATTWDFSEFQNMDKAVFPKRMMLSVGGQEIVRSEILLVRSLKPKALAEIRKQWTQSAHAQAGLGQLPEHLVRLLGYR